MDPEAGVGLLACLNVNNWSFWFAGVGVWSSCMNVNIAGEFNRVSKPFDGTNFAVWKTRISALLEFHDVSDTIEEIPDDPPRSWRKRNAKVKCIIMGNVADSHMSYCDQEYAYDIMEDLKEAFLKKDLAAQMYVRKKILSMRIGDNDIDKHLQLFYDAVRELRASGCVLDEVETVIHLLDTFADAKEYTNQCQE